MAWTTCSHSCLQEAHVELRVARRRTAPPPSTGRSPRRTATSNSTPWSCRNRTAQACRWTTSIRSISSPQRVREVLLDVLGEVRRVGREQDAVRRLRCRPSRARCLARCMATTVLPVPAPPRTRAGPLKRLGDQPLLAGVEEDPPLRQRGVEDRGQVVVRLDGDEPPPGVGVLQGRGQVGGIDPSPPARGRRPPPGPPSAASPRRARSGPRPPPRPGGAAPGSPAPRTDRTAPHLGARRAGEGCQVRRNAFDFCFTRAPAARTRGRSGRVFLCTCTTI